MTVAWTGLEPKGKNLKVAFEIVLPANAATIEDSQGNLVNLEFIGVARGPSGQEAGHFSQTIQGKMKPETVEQIRSSGITYRNTLELPRGSYSVRFVVRDNLSGRMGSVLAPITVQ
jgi:hypothetical protein